MKEPWTPGPWHEEREMLLNAEGIIICDPYGPNPQDRRVLEAAPEMAELLAELDEADGFISAIELNSQVNGEAWMDRRDALLARIRGEA
jgi:hypothetical protein